MECSNKHYFDENGNCAPVTETCQVFDSIRKICNRCYEGYKLEFGKCVLDGGRDPLCGEWRNQACVRCSEGSYMRRFGCMVINSLCKEFDFENNVCVGCYKGYELNHDRNCVEEEAK